MRQLVLVDWNNRWKRAGERFLRPELDRGGKEVLTEDTPLNKRVLLLHKELRNAENSVLVQARTKRVGFAKFLHTHRVPGVLTVQCSCSTGEETARHVAVYCTS